MNINTADPAERTRLGNPAGVLNYIVKLKV